MHARPTVRIGVAWLQHVRGSGFARLTDGLPDPTRLPQMAQATPAVANAIEPARLLMLSATTATIIVLSR